MTSLNRLLETTGKTLLCGVPEGLDGLAVGDYARALGAQGKGPVLYVTRDDQRLAATEEALSFFAPDLTVYRLPAWDCLPYDRVSPRPDIVAERVSTLARIAQGERPHIVLTTVNAVLQRVPDAAVIAEARISAAPGNRIDVETLKAYFAENGFNRTGTVVDPGDYAIRGGIIDLYAPGASAPVRLDLFGDTLESIRTFDPESQRTVGQLKHIDLMPASEVLLNQATIARFRTAYAAQFGGVVSQDPLYEAVKSGHRYAGIEHWLPLFHESLQAVPEAVSPSAIVLDHLADDAARSRFEQIKEYYDARVEAREQEGLGAPPYNPIEPASLFLGEDQWRAVLDGVRTVQLTPFEQPDDLAGTHTLSLGGRQGRTFAAERSETGGNVFEAVRDHIDALRSSGKRVIVAGWSDGSRDRLGTVLADHDITDISNVETWADVTALTGNTSALAVLGLETGFETGDLAVIGEQDILGDRLIRRTRKVRRAQDFLTEVSTLSKGDIVVHVDHGIGRFEGLQTITVNDAPHDCLFLVYHGGDRLFLPVENIELLSRYGSDDAGAQLDKLGGSGWQARKAKLKQRIREIAERLIKTAAARQLKSGEVMAPRKGSTMSSVPASRSRKPRTRAMPSMRSWTILPAAVPWTAWSAVMSASARPKSL